MTSDKFVKSVSFNKKNEKDRKMLNHISRRNFSGYVKKLIMADIESKEKEKALKNDSVKNETYVKPKKNIYEIAQQKKNPPNPISKPLLNFKAGKEK